MIKDLGYDSIKDFAPIATVGSGSWMFVVAPSVPARSVKELVDYAKANPGKLNWGFGVETGPHLARGNVPGRDRYRRRQDILQGRPAGDTPTCWVAAFT